MAHKYYLYTVTGSGPFPTDMLRYDRCWPAEERPLPRGYSWAEDPDSKTPIEHRVQVVGLVPPHRGRWESFGWRCGPIERIDGWSPPTKKLAAERMRDAEEILRAELERGRPSKGGVRRALEALEDQERRSPRTRQGGKG